jgi:flavin reductase (DIM6/NTAB) family NADH-FMN oxidoreductase RutF
MSISSKRYESIVDKFELSNVTRKECSKIPSFYVREAKISYECKLREVINFGNEDKAGNLVLADVIALNINDDLLDSFQIDIEGLNPIGRLSASYYSNINSKFEIKKDI